MKKKELIDNFVETAYSESNYMEVIHSLMIGRLGWTRYANLDNATGNILVQVIEKYLVEKNLFTDLGFAYGFSKEQLWDIGELMFSETPTQLDLEIMRYV